MKCILFLVALAILGVNCDDVATISYSTLTGTADPFHSHNFSVIAGITFFDVMEMQSTLYPDEFGFTSIEYPELGHFITSIGGLENDYKEKVAWQLYILPEYPNINNGIPDDSFRAQSGVDSLKVSDGQHYLFIYLEYHVKN